MGDLDGEPGPFEPPSPISGLVSGSAANIGSGEGCSARRWTRSTISISIAGALSSSSSTYQRR